MTSEVISGADAQSGVDNHTLVKTEPAQPASLAVSSPDEDVDSLEQFQSYKIKLVQVVGTLNGVLASIADRVSADVYESLTADIAKPAAVLEALVINVQNVCDSFIYVKSCLYLKHKQPLSSDAHIDDSCSHDSLYMEALQGFATIHYTWQGRAPAIDSSSVFPSHAIGSQITLATQACVDSIGAVVYEAHLQSNLRQWARDISAAGVVVALPSEATIDKLPLDELPPKIIARPSPDVLCSDLCVQAPAAGTRWSELALKEAPHWKSLRFLMDFTEKLSLTTLEYAAFDSHDDMSSGPVDHVTTCMESACTMRDMAYTCSAVAKLLSSQQDDVPIEFTQVQQHIVPMLAALMERCGDLEELGRKLVVLEVETTNVQKLLACTIGSLIAWQKTMTQVNRRFLEEVVSLLEKHIRLVELTVRAGLPQWQPCFETGVFKDDLAKEMCSGKQAGIVKSHNLLFNMMAECVSLHQELHITPSIAEHSTTKAIVAITKMTLSNCKDAAKVCRGVEILTQKHSIDGAKNAQTFIELNEGGFAHLPELFWSELKQVAAYSSSDAALPVKPEVDSSSCPATPVRVKEDVKSSLSSNGSLVEKQDGLSRQQAVGSKKGLKRSNGSSKH